MQQLLAAPLGAGPSARVPEAAALRAPSLPKEDAPRRAAAHDKAIATAVREAGAARSSPSRRPRAPSPVTPSRRRLAESADAGFAPLPAPDAGPETGSRQRVVAREAPSGPSAEALLRAVDEAEAAEAAEAAAASPSPHAVSEAASRASPARHSRQTAGPPGKGRGGSGAGLASPRGRPVVADTGSAPPDASTGGDECAAATPSRQGGVPLTAAAVGERPSRPASPASSPGSGTSGRSPAPAPRRAPPPAAVVPTLKLEDADAAAAEEAELRRLESGFASRSSSRAASSRGAPSSGRSAGDPGALLRGVKAKLEALRGECRDKTKQLALARSQLEAAKDEARRIVT